MWEKLSDDPKLFRHNRNAVYLAKVGKQPLLFSAPQLSVGEVLAMVGETAMLLQSDAMTAHESRESHAMRARR
jgi:hypothetical protein